MVNGTYIFPARAPLLNDQEVRKAYLGLHMLLNTGFAADLYGDRRRSSILQ